jgi:hypothetical protein
MSKKKNTLKDLDEFLKQQATTFVAPPRLSENSAAPEAPPPLLQESPVMKERNSASFENVAKELSELAASHGPAFSTRFYDLIIETIGKQSGPTPEDKMLINTALYLKNPNNWKEVIRAYWKKKA